MFTFYVVYLYTEKNGLETIFIQKLLVNFTINTELNVKMLSRRTETVFSFKTEIFLQ